MPRGARKIKEMSDEGEQKVLFPIMIQGIKEDLEKRKKKVSRLHKENELLDKMIEEKFKKKKPSINIEEESKKIKKIASKLKSKVAKIKKAKLGKGIYDDDHDDDYYDDSSSDESSSESEDEKPKLPAKKKFSKKIEKEILDYLKKF